MYCRKCGKEIPENSKFCPECGEQLAEEEVSEQDLDSSHFTNSSTAYVFNYYPIYAICTSVVAIIASSVPVFSLIAAIGSLILSIYAYNCSKNTGNRKVFSLVMLIVSIVLIIYSVFLLGSYTLLRY